LVSRPTIDYFKYGLINTYQEDVYRFSFLAVIVSIIGLTIGGLLVSKKENLDIFDINFYVTCLQQDVIERDVITSYINAKLNLTDENYTNEQMFRHLLTILDNLGTERKKVEKKRIIPRKIIVE